MMTVEEMRKAAAAFLEGLSADLVGGPRQIDFPDCTYYIFRGRVRGKEGHNSAPKVAIIHTHATGVYETRLVPARVKHNIAAKSHRIRERQEKHDRHKKQRQRKQEKRAAQQQQQQQQQQQPSDDDHLWNFERPDPPMDAWAALDPETRLQIYEAILRVGDDRTRWAAMHVLRADAGDPPVVLGPDDKAQYAYSDCPTCHQAMARTSFAMQFGPDNGDKTKTAWVKGYVCPLGHQWPEPAVMRKAHEEAYRT